MVALEALGVQAVSAVAQQTLEVAAVLAVPGAAEHSAVVVVG